jgi:CelD/BcsL family acetyltransferase involved in cellulose biosynthesis
MRIEMIQANELSNADQEHWRSLQLQNGDLSSPFFHPRFTAAVSEVRDDAFLAVFTDDAESVVGYLPFERNGRDQARPIGGRLSDYQAIVGANDLQFRPSSLLRACKVSRFQFDHWLTCQPCFEKSYYTTDGSPFLDLSAGFPAYEQARREMGGDELKQTQRKARKVEREVGPIRIEFHDESSHAWECLLDWKSEQYKRTGATDVFAFPRTRELLKKLLVDRTEEFGGILNALYAGDTLLAVHYGLFGDGTLHWWFPTYSPDCSNYSPGRVMLLELARNCAEFGITKIDLGRGMTSYKLRAMTGVAEVGDGTVDLNPVRRIASDTWRKSLERMRNSPLRAPARIPWQVVYRFKEWLAFR